MKNRLTIAIQKKGRLFDQSTDLIKKSGIYDAHTPSTFWYPFKLVLMFVFIHSKIYALIVSNCTKKIVMIFTVIYERSVFSMYDFTKGFSSFNSILRIITGW